MFSAWLHLKGLLDSRPVFYLYFSILLWDVIFIYFLWKIYSHKSVRTTFCMLYFSLNNKEHGIVGHTVTPTWNICYLFLNSAAYCCLKEKIYFFLNCCFQVCSFNCSILPWTIVSKIPFCQRWEMWSMKLRGTSGSNSVERQTKNLIICYCTVLY